MVYQFKFCSMLFQIFKTFISRLGLTPDSRSARENRTFPITSTLSGSYSWNDHTKLRILMQWETS